MPNLQKFAIMTIHFGLQFDDLVQTNDLDKIIVGPKKMRALLEYWFGLAAYTEENEFLRVERYRQAIKQYTETQPNTFYNASFEVDAFSTADILLQRRDELLISGFDFVLDNNMPSRLADYCNIELILKDLGGLETGEADALAQIMAVLPKFNLPFEKIILYDEFDHLPFYWQKLFLSIQQQKELSNITFSIEVIDFKNNLPTKDSSDLATLKYTLSGNKSEKKYPKADGSIIIVKGKRETDLAEWIAKMKCLNANFNPVCLIPETNRALDAAFVMEGIPALGIASSSSARPVMQLLKLVSAFLWRPFDPYRILQFLSLSIKPIDEKLAQVIAQVIAEKPGMYSSLWAARLNHFWENLKEKAKDKKNIDVQSVESQYKFWFERRRYDINGRVPKSEVIEIFEYLSNWAIDSYSQKKTPSLLALATQADKIKELLEALPERDLTNLELERIIKTVYKPSPVTLEEKQVASLAHIHQEAAIVDAPEQLLWWNFTDKGNASQKVFWRKEEIDFLSAKNCFLENIEKQNRIKFQQSLRPIFATRNQIILMIPAMIQGKETVEHPILGYLKACFGDISNLVFDVQNDDNDFFVRKLFNVCNKTPIDIKALESTPIFIEIPVLAAIKNLRAYETLTSLEELIYYPHKWAFKYKAKLLKSAILSVSQDKQLMGNLAHRVFELMLVEDFTSWSKHQTYHWIDENIGDILFKEGATLLMYGREQERERFINRMKYAAWNLIGHINANGWTVVKTEMDLEGEIAHNAIKGKADLVLQRGTEWAIVDLKYTGVTARRNLLRNMEDLQLTMYAHLLQVETLPYTSYFIIDRGKMLARHQLAFQEADIEPSELSYDEIHRTLLEKMIATYTWRTAQIQLGKIEVRTAATAQSLERYYDEQQEHLMQYLEMKSDDARWDDYGVIVRGVI